MKISNFFLVCLWFDFGHSVYAQNCISSLCQVPSIDSTIAAGSPLWVSPHRYWLAPLDPNASVQTATPLLTLARGADVLTFTAMPKGASGSVPAWIARYPAGSVVVYQSKDKGEDANFLVFVPGANGQGLVHWYAPDGTRTTFTGKSMFAMSQQTLDQQYRSAAAGDPEGLAAGSPKTSFTYLDDKSGLMTAMTDEQGRVTRYDWDAPTRRLLTVTETGPGGQEVVKRTELKYTPLWKYQYLSEVTERTFDGLGGEAVRRTRYGYSEYSKPNLLNYDVRLTSESYEVLGTGGDANAAQWVTTFYTKDDQARIVGIRKVAGLSADGPRLEPDTVISFGRSSLYGGNLKKTVQGTGPNRRERIQHFDKEGNLRREEVLTTSPTGENKEPYLVREYAYDANGNLTALTEPSGKRVAYRYNDLNQLVQRDVYLGTALVRSAQFEYDSFGRLSAEMTPKRQGQGYNYPEVRKLSQVTATHKVVKDGVTFELPATIQEAVQVGGQTTVTTTNTYDTQGRLTETRRSVGGKDRVSSYTYGNGQAATFALVRADGTVDEAQVRRAVQPSDKIASQTIAGVRTEFTYDQAGNPVVEVLKNGIVIGYDKGQPQTRDRRLLRAFDGFGNKTSESAFTGAADRPNLEAVKVWRYYSTGELRMSWEGNPENVTAYAYGTGANAGRLLKQTVGVGWDAGLNEVKTPREGTSYTYDAFGRQDSQTTLGGVRTAVVFDAQDRPVHEQKADGTTVDTTYSASGVPQSVVTTAGGITTAVSRDVDALGRVTREQVKAGDISYEVKRSFDPQDRVLREQDSRLDMNRPGDDQATYYVYDAQGNLVKQLGATMSTNGAYYDDRRPYVEYSFDGLNRKIEERKLLSGVMTPVELTLDTQSNLLGKQVAVTKYSYDDFDHPTTVTTPNGTVMTQSFDPAGNLTAQSIPNAGGEALVTRYGYDGAGRRVQTVNPAGESSRVTLNTLGLPTAQIDALGNTVKRMTYTPDGLLSSVAQPKAGTLSAQGLQANASNSDFILTEKYEYAAGQRAPVLACTALMDQGADTAKACTSVKFDAAGRPTTLTASDGSVTVQTYDALGRLTQKTTPDGRSTRYSYDALGRMTQEQITPNANDRAAGLTQGLTTTYTRNLLGQIISQAVNGVVTTRQFNSLGLPTAESLPATKEAREVPSSLLAYRLDGKLTAQTSASYQGALRGANARYEMDGQTTPSLSAGAVQIFQRNPEGQVVKESLIATAGEQPKTLMTATYTLNAQGLPVKREFVGDPGVYRAPLGTGANYTTSYEYDRAGRLTKRWDDVNGTHLNVQTLTYTPVGTVASASHDVRILRGDQIVAASEGSTNASYDVRGELLSSKVVSAGTTTATDYAYYADGKLAQANVAGAGALKVTGYDPLGRIQALTVAGLQGKLSAQFASKVGDSATVKTTYTPDGQLKQAVERGDGNCAYTRSVTSGLSGLVYGTQEWGDGCAGTPGTSQRTTFNALALPVQTTTTSGTQTLNVTRSFDALLRATNEQQSMTGTKGGQWSINRTFNSQGTLQAQTLQTAGSSSRTDYVVDGLGRQLTLNSPGSPYDGWQQRFDADGHVAALDGPNGQGVQFRYGTDGELLLSAQVGTDGRATSLAAQGIPGAPQIITLKSGGTTRTRNVTYTMLESIFGDRWNELAPQGTGGTLTALSAPTPLTSAQFSLNPLDVVAPVAAAGNPLTPLSVVAQSTSTPTMTTLSAPTGLLPSEAFGLKPGEVSAPVNATTQRPDVTGGQGVISGASTSAVTNPFMQVKPPAGWQPTGLPALSFQATPTSSLLEELRRLALTQRGPFGENK